MATRLEPAPTSYEALVPLPIPADALSDARLALHRIALLIPAIGIAAAGGAQIAMATMAVKVLTGALIGGVVGLVGGIFVSMMMKIPTLVDEYRIATLNQIKQTTSDDRVQKAIKRLKLYLQSPLVRFKQTYMHHFLHNEITVITKSVSTAQLDVQKVWRAFLTHLDKRPVINADGNKIALDFSRELNILDGTDEFLLGIPEQLDPNSLAHDSDFQEIEEIQKISFGIVGTFNKNLMKDLLRQDPDNFCLGIRRCGKIVAFAWVIKDGDEMYIAGLARRPEIAGVNLGSKLMKHILFKLKEQTPIYLHVRISNTAKTLYEAWGFKTESLIPNYYSQGPKESAYKMRLDWPTFLRIKEQRSSRSEPFAA